MIFLCAIVEVTKRASLDLLSSFPFNIVNILFSLMTFCSDLEQNNTVEGVHISIFFQECHHLYS